MESPDLKAEFEFKQLIARVRAGDALAAEQLVRDYES